MPLPYTRPFRQRNRRSPARNAPAPSEIGGILGAAGTGTLTITFAQPMQRTIPSLTGWSIDSGSTLSDPGWNGAGTELEITVSPAAAPGDSIAIPPANGLQTTAAQPIAAQEVVVS